MPAPPDELTNTARKIWDIALDSWGLNVELREDETIVYQSTWEKEFIERIEQELRTLLEVTWIPCSERMPPVSDKYLWATNYEQLWGLAQLTDGESYHSEDFWRLLGGDSVSQMFVTHWAEIDYPDLPERG